jgi:hypothetical protein
MVGIPICLSLYCIWYGTIPLTTYIERREEVVDDGYD